MGYNRGTGVIRAGCRPGTGGRQAGYVWDMSRIRVGKAGASRGHCHQCHTHASLTNYPGVALPPPRPLLVLFGPLWSAVVDPQTYLNLISRHNVVCFLSWLLWLSFWVLTFVMAMVHVPFSKSPFFMLGSGVCHGSGVVSISLALTCVLDSGFWRL